MKQKYLSYTVEDYLSDDDFLRSIEREEDQSLWKDWLRAHPEAQSTYDEAIMMTKSMVFKEEAFEQKESVWNRIEDSTAAKTVDFDSVSTSSRRYWISGAIAAGLAMFLLFIYQGYKTQLDDISTGSLAATEMTLPAGSVITDIDGTVDFDKTDWGSERHVQLSGTATFEVTKGVPFIVETDNGQVRVLGTKFTVTSEGDQFSVDVDHGKVKVTSGSRTQILTDQMSYHKNMEPGSTLSDNSIAYFQYDEAPLEEIITTLESVYHIEIAVDADITIRQQYTGFFDSSDLKTSLQSVFWPLGLTYEIEGNQVSISKE